MPRSASPRQTPAMRQFARAKSEHPDCLVFFRMGDFYELFHEDAEEASRLLGITLTSRSKDPPIPMAGVPVRAVDGYLRRLLRMGRRVAVCEQMQDPAEAKGVVDREVVRVVTPGTLTEDSVLDARTNNYLAAVSTRGNGTVGLAWVDVSTGEFLVQEVARDRLADSLARVDPAECLVAEKTQSEGPDPAEPAFADRVRDAVRGAVTPCPDWTFDPETAERSLKEHFGVADLRGFGVEGTGPRVGAAGAVLQYLSDTQRTSLGHLRPLSAYREDDRLVLDRVTLRSLEIARNLRDGGRDGTLLDVVDRTVTAMGARRLRATLLAPLRDRAAIVSRLDGVEELAGDGTLRRALRSDLKGVRDLERLGARASTGRADARDLVALRDSAACLPLLRRTLEGARTPVLGDARDALDPLEDLHATLAKALVDAPPHGLRDGGLLRDGHDARVDELRAAGREGRRWLADLQAREAERSGIANLKVGYNSVFGYYLEATRSQASRAPEDWKRRQSLKNAERFVTPELKDLEKRITGADDRAKAREYDLFVALRGEVAGDVHRIQRTAAAVALLDELASFAEVSVDGGWVRPRLVDDPVLDVRDARHPVVERSLRDERFVPNDLRLGGDVEPLALITGPNMSGKSVFLRQAALLVVLAQSGCFVPAAAARIGLADRIFTRVGASDDLAGGRSTFMVEMSETANILHNATDRSLVLLDEVGRGTSTFDGVSLAWAITEHLAAHSRARTLFATHYHELTELAALVPGVRNLHCAVKEWDGGIVFLRRIREGGTDRSYGLHVAEIAGIPAAVLRRAAEVLRGLEASTQAMERGLSPAEAVTGRDEPAQRLLFEPPSVDGTGAAVLREIREADQDRLTPLEALKALHTWRERLRST